MSEGRLLDVAHVSKRGSSLRITIPRPIATELDLKPTDIVGFYLVEGMIVLRKVK